MKSNVYFNFPNHKNLKKGKFTKKVPLLIGVLTPINGGLPLLIGVTPINRGVQNS